ncbi:MAG TPA: metal-dependent hydrolase [Myxococcota bacterium]
MDTATQALLGAVVGQAGFSHKLGRRAVAWGAVGGLLPDLDVVATLTHGPFGEFLHHRGFTHALWFGPVVGPLLGYAVWRHYARSRREPRESTASPLRPPHPGDPELLRSWIGLFVAALFTHPLIDVFTSYGTQLFAPFSDQRYALNAVGIIDPFYSGTLVAALVAGRVLRGRPAAARRVAFAALALSWAYLGYGVALNERARADVEQRLAAAGEGDAQVRVYPTLLQPYLRRVVVRTADEVRVGLYTPWREAGPAFEGFRPTPPHPLVDALARTREGAIFVWFAMGETATRVTSSGDAFVVEISDLRYGFPGAPDRGFWGIRGVFDRDGRLREPVQRIEYDPPASTGSLIRKLWRAAWGDFSGMGLEGA